jgi:hypothetical protein
VLSTRECERGTLDRDIVENRRDPVLYLSNGSAAAPYNVREMIAAMPREIVNPRPNMTSPRGKFRTVPADRRGG